MSRVRKLVALGAIAAGAALSVGAPAGAVVVGGLTTHGLARSPITGPAGNVEFLAWLGGPGPSIEREAHIAQVVQH